MSRTVLTFQWPTNMYIHGHTLTYTYIHPYTRTYTQIHKNAPTYTHIQAHTPAYINFVLKWWHSVPAHVFLLSCDEFILCVEQRMFGNYSLKGSQHIKQSYDTSAVCTNGRNWNESNSAGRNCWCLTVLYVHILLKSEFLFKYLYYSPRHVPVARLFHYSNRPSNNASILGLYKFLPSSKLPPLSRWYFKISLN